MEEEIKKPREYFMVMFNPPDMTAETLYKTRKMIILLLGLNVQNLRGHCFDFAANMSDRSHGVQKKFLIYNRNQFTRIVLTMLFN